jgi:hypothetical protein
MAWPRRAIVFWCALVPAGLWAQDVVPLTPTRRPAGTAALDVTAALASGPLDGPVVDLAFLADARVALLSPAALSVYRVESGALTLDARQPLLHPLAVRSPAGTLVVSERERALWLATNTSAETLLLAWDGRRITERQRAGALPWPGAPEGVRYRPGTNQLEGPAQALGAAAFLALRGETAVATDGAVLVATKDGARRTGVRGGSALAPLWPGVIAVSGAAPPGAADALSVYDVSGSESLLLAVFPVEGTIRALGARTSGDRARILAAASDGRGTRMLLLDVARRRP